MAGAWSIEASNDGKNLVGLGVSSQARVRQAVRPKVTAGQSMVLDVKWDRRTRGRQSWGRRASARVGEDIVARVVARAS